MADADRCIHHTGPNNGVPTPHQRLVCPSIGCAADGWYIEAGPRHTQTWQISSADGRGSWAITAETPICPLCGKELDQQHDAALEHNLFSRFVRGLAA